MSSPYNKVSDEDLQKLLDASAKATNGPWQWSKPDKVCETFCVYEMHEDDPPIVECHNWQEEANAKLIAWMRNCLVDMITEIKEHRKNNDLRTH